MSLQFASNLRWDAITGLDMAIVILCLTLALILCGSKLSTTAEKQSPRGILERSPREKREVRDLPRAPTESDDGGWCFCCTGRSAKQEKVQLSGALDPSVGSTLSPKFCGWRLQDPEGPLPAFSPFQTGEWLIPDDWEHLLQQSPAERASCQNLLDAIGNIPGPKDPMTLLRYLRARQSNVVQAAKMYQNSMQWREETGYVQGFFDGTIDDTLHRRLDQYWKPFGLLGWDRDGNPVVHERMGRVNLQTLLPIPDEFLIKHQVYLEVRLQQAMNEQMLREGRPLMHITVVEDVSGLGLQHLNMQGMMKFKKVVRVGADYFPEILCRVLVVRAPWIFSQIWGIVQHFFDEGTRAKIQIVSSRDTYKVMNQHIESKWIPKDLGGNMCVGSSALCEPFLPAGGAVPQKLLDDIVKSCQHA